MSNYLIYLRNSHFNFISFTTQLNLLLLIFYQVIQIN